MFQDPAFWVAIAFLGFIALLTYLKVPSMVTSSWMRELRKDQSGA